MLSSTRHSYQREFVGEGEAIKTIDLFHQQTVTFFVHLFTAHAAVKALCVVLDVSYKCQLQMSFDSPNTILVCPKCLIFTLPLFPTPIYFLREAKSCKFPVQPCQYPDTSFSFLSG